MKLFPAKSLWAGNIAKSITSEGKNAMLPRILTKTAVAREQNVIEGGGIIAFD